MPVVATDVPPVMTLTAAASGFATAVQALLRNRVHLIVCSAAALWAWPAFLGRTIRAVDFVIVPLVVVAVYQWNRLTDRYEDAINCPADLRSALAHRTVIIGTCVASVSAVVVATAMTFERRSAALLVALVLLGFFYGAPIHPSRPRARLKSVLVLKNLSSAAGWATLTLVYPLLHASQNVDGEVWLAVAAMLVGVLSSELIWDVRDMAGDAASGVRSLPVCLGTRAVAAILFGVNGAFTLFVTGSVAAGLWPARWLFLATSSLLCAAAALQLPRFAHRGWTHVIVLVQTVLLLVLGVVGRL